MYKLLRRNVQYNSLSSLPVTVVVVISNHMTLIQQILIHTKNKKKIIQTQQVYSDMEKNKQQA